MVALTSLWGPAALGRWTWYDTGTNLPNGFDLNDADNNVAWIFSVPLTGTIDQVGISCKSIAGNPPAYNAGLVTVDADGNPTATDYGSSVATTYDFTATGWHWITLATAATAATVGEMAAVRIWPTASAPDGPNNAQLAVESFIEPVGSTPRGVYQYSTGGNWYQNPRWTGTAVHYTTGEVVGLPVVASLHAVFKSGDTPDEVGGLFTMPFTATAIGVRVGFHQVEGDASWKVHLYDIADVELALLTVTDEDIWHRAGCHTWDGNFAAAGLASGEQYRLTIESTHAGNGISVAGFDFNSVADKVGYPEGAAWQKTSRTNGGAWTEDESACPHIALWLSDIEVGHSLGSSLWQ